MIATTVVTVRRQSGRRHTANGRPPAPIVGGRPSAVGTEHEKHGSERDREPLVEVP